MMRKSDKPAVIPFQSACLEEFPQHRSGLKVILAPKLPKKPSSTKKKRRPG